MKSVRVFISCITREQCSQYIEEANLVKPVNTPICKDLSTLQVLDIGCDTMGKEGFILSRGINDV